MSIQDDIFDVGAALEGKPEAKQFADLMDYLSALEEQNRNAIRRLGEIESAVTVFKQLWKRV